MTIAAALFDTHQDADQALEQLERAGFPREAISVVMRTQEQQRSVGGMDEQATSGNAAQVDAGAFAFGGAALGGLLGLLAGLGALAIPGIGPVLAVGTLGAAIGGTAGGAALGGAAGGLIGSLTGRGLTEEEAHIYAEGVRRGGILVAVEADGPAQAQQAQQILRAAGAVDQSVRRSQWQEQGWQRFDEQGEPWNNETTHTEQRQTPRGVQARQQDQPQHETPTTVSEERSHNFMNDVQSAREVGGHTNAEGSYPNVGATGPGNPVRVNTPPLTFPPKIGTGTGQVADSSMPTTQRQGDDTPVFNNANDSAPTTRGQMTPDGDYPTLGSIPGAGKPTGGDQAIDPQAANTAYPDIVESGTGRPVTGRDVPNQDYPTGKPMRGSGDQPRDADLGEEEGPAGSASGRFRTN